MGCGEAETLEREKGEVCDGVLVFGDIEGRRFGNVGLRKCARFGWLWGRERCGMMGNNLKIKEVGRYGYVDKESGNFMCCCVYVCMAGRMWKRGGRE